MMSYVLIKWLKVIWLWDYTSFKVFRTILADLFQIPQNMGIDAQKVIQSLQLEISHSNTEVFKSSHFEILWLMTFIWAFCDVLNIMLKKWPDILLVTKRT